MNKNTTVIIIAVALILTNQASRAGSATWQLNPTSGDWNTAGNWTPATVPNSPTDIATFAVSNTTDVSLSADVEVSEIIFDSDASPFVIASGGRILTLSGSGISNNSGMLQTFVSSFGEIVFKNDATAGSATLFLVDGPNAFGLEFLDSATAGTATFSGAGGAVTSGVGGATDFFGTSTAADGTFTNKGGTASGANGAVTTFRDSSTAANATLTNEGGAVSGAFGGITRFFNTSNAGNATLVANPGAGGADGGSIQFFSLSTGGTARVEVFGKGTLDIINANRGLRIGSLEGDGNVLFGKKNLSVGGNNLNTVFAGTIIQAFGNEGSLTKIGKGILTLTGANHYGGGTTIVRGKLEVSNTTGSGTGPGPVQVNGGTLAGKGTIRGAVTVGTGSGPGAVLSPGQTAADSRTLTIQSALVLNSDTTYNCQVNSNDTTSDEVIVNGVTINGALFSVADIGSSTLTSGTVLTVISNTAATPITGTFSNLADDSTITAGSNTFQVDYQGGDGNDLTLTVVP